MSLVRESLFGVSDVPAAYRFLRHSSSVISKFSIFERELFLTPLTALVLKRLCLTSKKANYREE
jgi:hypothetical protein